MKLVARAPHGVASLHRADRLDETWCDPSGVVWAVCEHDGSHRRLVLPGLGKFELDVTSGRIVGRSEAGVDPAFFERRFWKEAVPMLHQANGALCLHASAVAVGDAAVAFVGGRTAGKSSLARAWSTRRGHPQLADDVAVLYPGGAGGFELHPLPFFTKVQGPAREALGECDLVESAPREPLALAHLVFVRPVAEPPARLRRLAAAALPELLRESSCFLLDDREARRRFFATNLDLLATVPCHRLVYPHRLDSLDATLGILEAEVASRGASARL